MTESVLKQGEQKYILTTEKDSVRILNNPYFPPELREYIYYIPIKVQFLPYENKDFVSRLMKLINAWFYIHFTQNKSKKNTKR